MGPPLQLQPGRRTYVMKPVYPQRSCDFRLVTLNVLVFQSITLNVLVFLLFFRLVTLNVLVISAW
jgi:hypothetical protein